MPRAAAPANGEVVKSNNDFRNMILNQAAKEPKEKETEKETEVGNDKMEE